MNKKHLYIHWYSCMHMHTPVHTHTHTDSNRERRDEGSRKDGKHSKG